MNRKWLGILLALMLTLVACQTADETGQGGTLNPNVDPTTNRNTGDGMIENNQNRMMQQNPDTNRRGETGNYGYNETEMQANDEYRQRRGNQNEDSRYEVANEAAEKITSEVDEIERAYVLTTDNNAYVAAHLKAHENENRNQQMNNNRRNQSAGEELTDEVKHEIGEVVRSVDRDIENVYVSTNPDFFDLTNNYADDLDNNRPVRGMFDQLGNMIERIFPQNANN